MTKEMAQFFQEMEKMNKEKEERIKTITKEHEKKEAELKAKGYYVTKAASGFLID